MSVVRSASDIVCVCVGYALAAFLLFSKTAHYALCTALMALSMMIPGLFAGALQESVGYPAFFVIVVVACVMTYVVTSLLRIDPEFGKKQS